MSRKVIPIFSEQDCEAVQPLLDALANKGVRALKKAAPGRGEVALLFLSKAFAADEALQRRFFEADSAGAEIIPLDLDGAEQPELVRSALLAKNAIAAQGRTAEEIAGRVASAEAFGKRPRLLPRILIAAALLAALGAGLWLWLGRSAENGTEDTALSAMAESDLAAARRLGLTPEDLATINTFTIVGDANGMSRARFTTDSSVNPGLRVYLDDLAYDSWEDDGTHWYSTQDGHEFTLTHYDDLRIIELMPNLRTLTLVLVETDRMPALKELGKLTELRLENCRFGNLDWAREADILYFCCRGCDIEDFSAISSMKRLSEANIELGRVQRADFSQAGLRTLHNLWIEGRGNLREIDLSGLSACVLRELHLIDLPAEDIKFLFGQTELQNLELRNLPRLNSVAPLRDLGELAWFDVRDLPNVDDLTPLGACGRLKVFQMDNMRQIRDLDFLINCGSLQDVSLNDVELENLDFIEPMSRNFGVRLNVNGLVGDWSALADIKFYSGLDIRSENGSVAGILPYLAESKVGDLHIDNALDLDLAALPEVVSHLHLSNCPYITDLSALSDKHSFFEVNLNNLPRLRSLEGLERIHYFGKNDKAFRCNIIVENCPRLEDWSALNNTRLNDIRLRSVFTLPDFGEMLYAERAMLRLENIPGIRDLSFLDAIAAPEKSFFSFELVGLEDLEDLSALRRFRGEYIAVTPELEDLAQALVEAKCFDRLEIAYPAGGWDDEGYDDFQLLSLDELDTLSEAVLSHVTSVCIAGDQLVDRERYEVWDEWDGRRHHVVLVDRESDEKTEVKMGGVGELSMLSKLTGLRRLELYAQPLTSLEGIQSFSELEELRVQNCPRLTDAGAAFTLQGLRHFEVARSPITSIQGVQNLGELTGLFIYETEVKDLSPLWEIDYGASLAQGGFALSLGGTDCGDYRPVEAIPALSMLDLNGATLSSSWPDLSKVGELREFSAHGTDLTQEVLESILAAHPELEELQIPYNREIRDLTPLLGMEKLRYVIVSNDMREAVASLEGQTPGFELEIRDF